MEPGETSDGELLAASGSRPDAFAAFYDRYETALVGYFTRRTGDAEVAADLTAEVFAAALGAAQRYRPEAPTAAGWLFTIARNTLSKSLRRGRVEANARRRVGIREAVAFTGDDIAGELETSELVVRKRVSRGLSNLRAELEKPS
jgi:DNA-directed RNA polymerase specialized sigma24 family protein